MNDAKSAVRAALLELIEADGNMDKAPWQRGMAGSECLIYTDDMDLVFVLSASEHNLDGIALSRNLAPSMARGILKMLDEPECNECAGSGETWLVNPREKVPCPRCAARWQEWAGWLGVA